MSSIIVGIAELLFTFGLYPTLAFFGMAIPSYILIVTKIGQKHPFVVFFYVMAYLLCAFVNSFFFYSLSLSLHSLYFLHLVLVTTMCTTMRSGRWISHPHWWFLFRNVLLSRGICTTDTNRPLQSLRIRESFLQSLYYGRLTSAEWPSQSALPLLNSLRMSPSLSTRHMALPPNSACTSTAPCAQSHSCTAESHFSGSNYC